MNENNLIKDDPHVELVIWNYSDPSGGSWPISLTKEQALKVFKILGIIVNVDSNHNISNVMRYK